MYATGYDYEKVKAGGKVLVNNITAAHACNRNLTEPEKEILRCHQRMAHLGFQTIQFLMKLGVLAFSKQKRQLHRAASKLKTLPKCASCLFGKQTR